MFFWYYYFSCFQGVDNKKELNIDDALQEIIPIDTNELNKWNQSFFKYSSDEKRYIFGQLSESISFQIEFEEYEILFFINDNYIGNLGGHFECWSLTLEELLFFSRFDFVFLLLLPMLGITEEQFDYTKKMISKNIKIIPELEFYSDYIAECITNGLVMNGKFYIDKDVGIVNNQNHSIRNITEYPRYKECVIRLNKIFKKE